MNTVSLLCADDQSLTVDIESIRARCPPVLLRFLGAVDGFKAPPTNAKGQLLFAQEYGITRFEMAACVAFLRSGALITDMNTLMHDFAVFGGCDALDERYMALEAEERARKAALEAEERARKENPMIPSEDDLNMFTWAVHERGWSVEEGWSCVSQVKNTLLHFWYRKRN